MILGGNWGGVYQGDSAAPNKDLWKGSQNHLKGNRWSDYCRFDCHKSCPHNKGHIRCNGGYHSASDYNDGDEIRWKGGGREHGFNLIEHLACCGFTRGGQVSTAWKNRWCSTQDANSPHCIQKIKEHCKDLKTNSCKEWAYNNRATFGKNMIREYCKKSGEDTVDELCDCFKPEKYKEYLNILKKNCKGDKSCESAISNIPEYCLSENCKEGKSMDVAKAGVGNCPVQLNICNQSIDAAKIEANSIEQTCNQSNTYNAGSDDDSGVPIKITDGDSNLDETLPPKPEFIPKEREKDNTILFVGIGGIVVVIIIFMIMMM